MYVCFVPSPSLGSSYTYPVRLVGSSDPTQGYVQVHDPNNTDTQWGYICGYSWYMQDANVVCRMLGYEGGLPRKPALPSCELLCRADIHLHAKFLFYLARSVTFPFVVFVNCGHYYCEQCCITLVHVL